MTLLIGWATGVLLAALIVFGIVEVLGLGVPAAFCLGMLAGAILGPVGAFLADDWFG